MKQALYSALGILLLSSLGAPVQAQTSARPQTYITLASCSEGRSMVDYIGQSCSPKEEKRADTETVGNTSFTFSNYSSTVAGAARTAAGISDDVFQFTNAFSSQIAGPALVWRQNSTATTMTSEQGTVVLSSPYKAQVTLTFTREVTNLRLTIQDIDKALLNSNQGSDFTDEVDFYATDANNNPTDISGNNTNVQVGYGTRNADGTYDLYSKTVDYSTETRDGLFQAVLRGKALNGGSASTPTRDGNATIVFTKPVKKLVLTYRNLYTRTSSALRLQTIAIERISWCTVAGPLPVKLTSFDATAAGADAHLAWATASEVNNDYFGVERSFDGVTFSQIGRVSGHGSTAAASSYTYTDASVAPTATGTVYYRLRQVDLDGTATYSPVRTAAFQKGLAALKLYPNPATPGDDKLTLDLLTLPQGEYQASLVNVVGSTVATFSVRGGEAQPLALPTTLIPGTYLVRVQGQGINLTQRLARQ
ncbi:MAG: T9SS type A sorting domain-containing protein [Hymenobacter sp.]|nr:MAG: T9SS type A sorting domain-containing protein [Hymenobacter sp.]